MRRWLEETLGTLTAWALMLGLGLAVLIGVVATIVWIWDLTIR